MDFDNNSGPILPRFRHIRAFFYAESTFLIPLLIPVKISWCSLWSRSVIWVFAESEHPKLTDGEIILEDFQPI